MGRYHELSLGERVSIQIGLERGESVSAIAAVLGRSTSTVSREVSRHSECGRYAADEAHCRAQVLRQKPRRLRKLADGLRWERVQQLLRQRWSPQQIALRLRQEHPDDRRGAMSHETIYQAIYLTPRGALRSELIACLRRGHRNRLPRSRGQDRRDLIPDMRKIHIRPPEVEQRLIPGHWEGDLIKGEGNRSAVGVLVERVTGFVVLARMPSASAVSTLNSFDAALRPIPPGLRKTLTYDQGREMAAHLALTARLGMEVYFADPHSPWQRGSCENTNGLLRQYLPKGTDLSRFSQDELNAIALSLNTRPRIRLKIRTPLECFTEQLALDQMKTAGIQ